MLPLLLALSVSLVLAQRHHALQHPLQPWQQPEATPALDDPAAPLPWSHLNVLHTTDTHGWLRGHLGSSAPESSFSGDWGDLYSFTSHLKRLAKGEAADLLLVDTGDLHDGNGLADRDPAVRGTIASNIMKVLPYDIMTVGNHELYNYSIALDFHQRFVPQLHGRYLASNVLITLPNGHTKRFAAPYRRFTTSEQGIRILALGTLFNFTYSAPEIHVQPIAQMVNEAWFRDVMQESGDKTDVLVLAGHMAADDPDGGSYIESVESTCLTFPYCYTLDQRSTLLASGRYMETIGWMSLNLSSAAASPIQRRYLDQNRRTYAYHSYLSDAAFDTPVGVDLSRNLTDWSKALNLSYVFGQAPHSYYLSRYPYTSEQSIFHLLLHQIFPALIKRDDRPQPQPLMILNSGSVRFDISAGAFTTDSQSLVFPFINRNLYIPDVPTSIAKLILKDMNEVGEYHREGQTLQWHQQMQDESHELHVRRKMSSSAALQTEASGKLSFGYVTLDQCEGRGDDTRHVPLPYFEPPVFVGTEWDESAETVDVAFFDFIGPMVIDALNRVQDQRAFKSADVQEYTSRQSHTLLGEYASLYWT